MMGAALTHVPLEKWKVLWYFLRPQRSRSFGALLVMFVSGALEALNVAALYPIINYGLNAHSHDPRLASLEKIFSAFGSNHFLSACVLLLAVSVAASAVKIFYHYCSNQLVKRITGDNQRAIFEKYYSAPYEYFIEKKQGNLIYAGTVAPINISNNLLFIIRLANSTVTCVFFMICLLFLSWPATLIMIGLGAGYLWFIRGLSSRLIHRASVRVVEADKEKNVILNEFLTGIKTIKAFMVLDFWREKYGRVVEKSVTHNFQVLMGKVLPDSLIRFTFFTLIAILGISLRLKYQGDLVAMVPLLGTYVAIASRLFPYINLIGNDIVGIARNHPDSKLVYDVLTEAVRAQDSGERKFSAPFSGSIELKDVSFKYPGTEEGVLKGVSFSVPKGRMTALVGPSGSGKSTIIHLLLKMYAPDAGRILLDGADIHELDTASYLGKIGFVSQDTFIFHGSVKDNILFGRGPAAEEDLFEAARLANAHGFILDLPDGYDTIVGDAGAKISGGQKQRLALARAVLKKPEILFLDEATSSLDTVSERAVQEAINKICRQTTILVVAHRLSTVQNADNIIVLEKGRVLEQGTHRALLEKQQAYFNLHSA